MHRVATASTMNEELETFANGVGSESLGTIPENSGEGSDTLAPLGTLLGGAPFRKAPTSTSIATVSAIPGSSSSHAAPSSTHHPHHHNHSSPTHSHLPTTSESSSIFGLSKPTIHLTEIASVDPIGSLMQALGAPGVEDTFPLIVMGHYGPAWTGSHGTDEAYMDANQGTVNGTHQRTQWSVLNQGTFQGASGVNGGIGGGNGGGGGGGKQDKVLGPTGDAIVSSRAVQKSSLLVVRKLRVDPKLKEV
jgi:hypothetical protein